MFLSRAQLLGLAVAAVGMLTTARPATAQLATYTFTGSPGTLAPTTVDPDVSAGSVNFTGSAGSQANILSDNFVFNAANSTTSAALAVSNNSYFQFTVTPDSLKKMSLTSLDFDGAFGSAGGFVVRSSVDSFATNLQSQTWATGYPTFTSYSTDLTGSQFQDLSSATTFRVYVFTTSGAGGNAAVFDNMALNGFIPVPEPTSILAVSALAMTGVAGLRRRFARRQPETTVA